MWSPDGTERDFAFAYGRYCGPEYPPTSDAHPLGSSGSPIDDIDAACYAHDYCYALIASNDIHCDKALIDVLQTHYQPRLRNTSCWGLAHELVNAFFAKPYKAGRSASETAAGRVSDGTLGVVFALWLQGAKAPLTPFLRQIEEGGCNLGPESDVRARVAEFESAYAARARATNKPTIMIPLQK